MTATVVLCLICYLINQIPVTSCQSTDAVDSGDTTTRPVKTSKAPPSRHTTTPVLASCGVRCVTEPVNRIVGGLQAQPHSWPWQCRLEVSIGAGYMSLCGASVVSSSYIVTAAHCVYGSNQGSRLPLDPSKLSVICGDHNRLTTDSTEQTPRVSTIKVHGGYMPRSPINDYDIALLELDTPLTLNAYVQPLCLPDADAPEGTPCTVTGWGSMDVQKGKSSNVLREVVVPIVSSMTCNIAYDGIISHRMLCAGNQTHGGKDACSGDSGGPLVCKVNNRWELHGVVSFGNDCAKAGSPGVYTNVMRFRTWIQSSSSGTLINGKFEPADPSTVCVGYMPGAESKSEPDGASTGRRHANRVVDGFLIFVLFYVLA